MTVAGSRVQEQAEADDRHASRIRLVSVQLIGGRLLNSSAVPFAAELAVVRTSSDWAVVGSGRLSSEVIARSSGADRSLRRLAEIVVIGSGRAIKMKDPQILVVSGGIGR